MADSWRIQGLSVSSNGSEILSGIEVSFAPGSITLLVGRNGAGKSTLLETMAGLRPPNSGTILLGDQPLWLRKKLNRDVLLRTGVALQQSASQWFLPTAAAEFRYSLKPYGLAGEDGEAEERASAALEAVGMDAETFMNRDPRTLSGGQQKRLAFAMLLACRPEWLLLDEPTAGLDYDGVNRLRDLLASHRAAGGGAIVVTHELDALLPLADKVVVIEDGVIADVRTAAGHASAIHAAAPAAVPQPLQAAALLREAGFELPEAAPWAQPHELAAALASSLQARSRSGGQNLHITNGRPLTPKREGWSSDTAASATAPRAACAIAEVVGNGHQEKAADEPFRPSERSRARVSSAQSRPVSGDRLDPRAVIICYFLFSTGILLQQSWIGLTVATLLALFIVWLPLRSAIAPWRGAIVLYVRMIAAFVVFAGIGVSPLRFDWAEALITGFRMSKLLIVMVTGLPIAALTTPLRLQRALEQTFGWLERFKIPIKQAALAVALIFRFLPMLQLEWERFVRIARARGKSTAKPGKLPLRMLYVIMAPFLLGMLRGADEISSALEARGYGRTGSKPTRALVLRWSRTDSAAAALFAGLLAVLYALRLTNV